MDRDQLLRRQSAPRPTAEEAAAEVLSRTEQMPAGAVNGFDALSAPIGIDAIHEATATLQKYKQGKANLERQIISNEQWYTLRHWEEMRKKKAQEVEPVSGWLFNSLCNKHADAMDNFPSPNILPREEGDKPEAEILTSIIPIILDQSGFEATYSAVMDYKLKMGTGVYGVFWDASAANGLGSVSIKHVDLLNLYWEPGIKDIQDSRNVFIAEVVDNDALIDEYPQLADKLTSPTVDVARYITDDSIDTSTKSVVIGWYYRKMSGGRPILHYCRFVNDEILFATENDPQYKDRGLYDHGKYPFVFDVLFSRPSSPAGFGFIDVGKSAQEYIDRGNQAILKNLLANAKPRNFIRADGSVNEEEYADTDKELIHVNGNLGEDSIRPVQANPLNDLYITIINNKIDELKEVTGNRDISTGGTTGGVTAASAIAAMQEAGSKLSRDFNKASYRAYREVVLLTIELIRQFFDLPRYYRVLGDNGTAKFIEYTNAGLIPVPQSVAGEQIGYRIPLFDVEVTAEKASPYSRMSQNELALQFYSAGFFAPQNADAALACLDMMDFDRKQFIMQKVAENGGMYQQMLMMQQQMLALAQIVDQERGSNIAEQIAAGITGGAPVAPVDGASPTVGAPKQQESGVTRKARAEAAERSTPR